MGREALEGLRVSPKQAASRKIKRIISHPVTPHHGFPHHLGRPAERNFFLRIICFTKPFMIILAEEQLLRIIE